VWPELRFHGLERPEGSHDVVVLSGTEPHLRWRGFVSQVLALAEKASVSMIVTLGSNPAQTPHTRAPIVFASSTNTGLVDRLHLSRPQYQGVTGVLGVLQATLDTAGPPAIAMRVGVPHYAMSEHDPNATMALLAHLEHVTGVATDHRDLSGEVARWQQRLRTAVAADAEATAYVAQLEAHYDREAEQHLASGDDLAAELERFLREQGGDA
jgi:proteasome assembly chaperone (PAC2) family protein